MRSKKNDTALHETLQYVSRSINPVLPWLIDADPGFDYFANDAGETPLYLAVKNATISETEYILDKSPSQAHGAPDGRTVLHPVMQLHDYFRSADTVELLLKKKPLTVKEVDKDGRSALDYAASLYRAHAFVDILNVDSSVGYFRDKDGMTALHYVAGDHFNVALSDYFAMLDFIERMIGKLTEQRCPGCGDIRDHKGRNLLHIAAEYRKYFCFQYVFKSIPSSPTNDLIVINLINRREDNGNTPWDLLLSLGPDELPAYRDECLELIKRDPRTRQYCVHPRDYEVGVYPRNKVCTSSPTISRQSPF
ncbi:hypothetical protein MKW98_014967 [Papaver atlanticum]|uniref:Uncharacterized protein n=1 Tax=Papaver atlanticum TaxID=357466 RepID=A0AAD4SNW8_9MAGN|nr:hypothetical protein MKW98_014967 [Papaver atlanticum]